MPCPNCRSNDLWDDNLAWGCNDCSWFTTGGVRNADASRDTFNDPRPFRAPVRTHPEPRCDEPDE